MAELKRSNEIREATSVFFTKELDQPRTGLTRTATSSTRNTDAMQDRDRLWSASRASPHCRGLPEPPVDDDCAAV
ncbi:hypothetical protein ACWCOW_08825, partial [Streptomyces sp. NPDC001939]